MTDIIEYDPHLLYQAINITVELEYHVPMKLIYKLLHRLNEKRAPGEPEPSMDTIIALVKTLATAAESAGVEIEDTQKDLKSKIKLILKMLGCDLSNDDLNKILKGDVSIETALNKEAQIAWKLIFEKDDDGRTKPTLESVNWLFRLAEDFAIGKIIECQHQNYLKHCDYEQRRIAYEEQRDNKNLKTVRLREMPHKDYLQENVTLENKLRKLRLYLGHIQGYDRDLDRDGERGMDPETGEIRDYGDIFLSDKRYSGAIIEDKARDGIDIGDIK